MQFILGGGALCALAFSGARDRDCRVVGGGLSGVCGVLLRQRHGLGGELVCDGCWPRATS